MHTGRGILPENIQEFSEYDDLQKEIEDPYSRDYLICTVCEDKLSRLEAIFASQLNDKKLSAAIQAKSKTLQNHTVLVDPRYNSSLYQLLIQSIFYRCSKGRFNGFRLNLKVENKIEQNLRTAFLIKNFKKLKANAEIDIHYKFPIITCSFFVPEGDDPTKKFIATNQSRFPYFIMAGKWTFQLFENEKHIKSSVEWLYGLRDKLHTLETYSIIKDKANVIILDPETSEAIFQNHIHYFTDKRIAGVNKNIKSMFLHFFKQKPNENTTGYIFQQYITHLNQDKPELQSMAEAFNDYVKLW